jgi:hypothetical protein
VVLIVTDQKIPWDKLPDDSEEDLRSDDEGETLPDVLESTELEQLATHLSKTIDCLFRITSIIQSRDPFEKFMKSARIQFPRPQPWDESSVRQNFGDLEPWLMERLCRAISCRRQFFADRRERHEKIKSATEKQIVDGESRTVISSLPTVVQVNPSVDYGLPMSEVPEENTFDEGASDGGFTEDTTSYAPTLEEDSSNPVPKLPEEGEGGAFFECPLCFRIVGGFCCKKQWK